MGFRNIMISSNMKLRIQDQQLVVTAGDEVHIPLEDINCIFCLLYTSPSPRDA